MAVLIVGVVCLLLLSALTTSPTQCADDISGANCVVGVNIGLGLMTVLGWLLCGVGLLCLVGSIALMLVGSISRRQEQQSLQKTLDALRHEKEKTQAARMRVKTRKL